MSDDPLGNQPSRKQIARWQKYLANERAEGAVYRSLASKRTGEEREILLAVAEAEARHEAYWRDRLGPYVGMPRKASLGTRLLAWMANRFGSVFVLAMMQAAETRNDYAKEQDATSQMAADETIHAEVVRGLAARSRARMSGDFRAAIFGVNDGLVSNLALVLGVVGSGASASYVIITGVAGLLAGALSMAAGEYVSVSSQQELLRANTPNPQAAQSVGDLDVQENELELVYRARGLSAEEARAKARQVFEQLLRARTLGAAEHNSAETEHAGIGNLLHHNANAEEEHSDSPIRAAVSSFLLFFLGAAIPLIPYVCGMEGTSAAVLASILVGVALILTGAIVGVLSGTSPLTRAARQLLIGFIAAGATFALGSLFTGV